MPIYEYLCSNCDYKFDKLQKMSDDPLKNCPECREDTLTKLVSAPSFRLSGSGWYETDFKSDTDKKKNLAGDRDKPKSSDAPSSKSESAKPQSDTSKAASTEKSKSKKTKS